MIRAVLDTNIIVSALAFPGRLQERILRRATEFDFEIVIPDHLFDELANTLAKPFFAALLHNNPPSDLYDALMRAPRVWIAYDASGAATHPEDDLVLATAVSGKADYLVTGDKQLLKLGSYGDVLIVDSGAFLDLLLRQDAQRLDR